MSVVYPCSWSDRTREEIEAPCCPDCEAQLFLHQPDPRLPNRLLAVCEDCKAWFLSDAHGFSLTPIPIEQSRRLRGPKLLG